MYTSVAALIDFEGGEEFRNYISRCILIITSYRYLSGLFVKNQLVHFINTKLVYLVVYVSVLEIKNFIKVPIHSIRINVLHTLTN